MAFRVGNENKRKPCGGDPHHKDSTHCPAGVCILAPARRPGRPPPYRQERFLPERRPNPVPSSSSTRELAGEHPMPPFFAHEASSRRSSRSPVSSSFRPSGESNGTAPRPLRDALGRRPIRRPRGLHLAAKLPPPGEHVLSPVPLPWGKRRRSSPGVTRSAHNPVRYAPTSGARLSRDYGTHDPTTTMGRMTPDYGTHDPTSMGRMTPDYGTHDPKIQTKAAYLQVKRVKLSGLLLLCSVVYVCLLQKEG